ncbi:hypothetical protein ABZP36_000881 [Zizania latifolia]
MASSSSSSSSVQHLPALTAAGRHGTARTATRSAVAPARRLFIPRTVATRRMSPTPPYAEINQPWKKRLTMSKPANDNDRYMVVARGRASGAELSKRPSSSACLLRACAAAPAAINMPTSSPCPSLSSLHPLPASLSRHPLLPQIQCVEPSRPSPASSAATRAPPTGLRTGPLTGPGPPALVPSVLSLSSVLRASSPRHLTSPHPGGTGDGSALTFSRWV